MNNRAKMSTIKMAIGRLNFFLTKKLSECDPTKILLPKAQILEIIQQAFYFDEELQQILEEEAVGLLKGRKTLSYYELMEFLHGLKIDYEVV